MYNKVIALLTKREEEVLRQVALGNTDHVIGGAMYISHHTVKTYRKNLLVKFDANNSSHLIYKACKMGFL